MAPDIIARRTGRSRGCTEAGRVIAELEADTVTAPPPRAHVYGVSLGGAAQLAAALGHDILGRLGQLDAPTLVVHGDEDCTVPAENGRILARAIRGARLELWPGAGHLDFTDEPEADRSVARFLSGLTSPGPSSAARP